MNARPLGRALIQRKRASLRANPQIFALRKMNGGQAACSSLVHFSGTINEHLKRICLWPLSPCGLGAVPTGRGKRSHAPFGAWGRFRIQRSEFVETCTAKINQNRAE